MNIQKKILSAGILFSALFAILFIRISRPSRFITREEPALGTFVTITIEKNTEENVIDEAFLKIRELEKIFNIHDPESEISILNRHKKKKVSNELLAVIKESIHLSEITDGAFDITAMPLISLYKNAEKEGLYPSEKDIRDALEGVGWRKILIDGQNVEIPQNYAIDTGGIAKGYIVDKTVELLKIRGIRNGLINAGGDIYCFGKNPNGGKWKIGIQDPFERDGIKKIIQIEEAGIATSGDYERAFHIQGRKTGHIVNPATGKTVKDSSASVTVIAENTLFADALATAFYVMGGERSVLLANSLNGIEALIVEADGRLYESAGFSKFMLP